MKLMPDQLTDKFLRMMSPADRKALGKAGVTFEEAQAKRADKLEREIHDDIEQYLRQREITYRHDRMDRKTTGTVGWPDFTFAINGRAVGIEVKRPGEEPRPEQVRCLQGLVRDGWVIRVAFDVADVVRVIKEVEGL